MSRCFPVSTNLYVRSRCLCETNAPAQTDWGSKQIVLKQPLSVYLPAPTQIICTNVIPIANIIFSDVHYSLPGESIPGLNCCYSKKTLPFFYQSYSVSPYFSWRAMLKPGYSTSAEVVPVLNGWEGWLHIVYGDEVILTLGSDKSGLDAGMGVWCVLYWRAN